MFWYRRAAYALYDGLQTVLGDSQSSQDVLFRYTVRDILYTLFHQGVGDISPFSDIDDDPVHDHLDWIICRYLSETSKSRTKITDVVSDLVITRVPIQDRLWHIMDQLGLPDTLPLSRGIYSSELFIPRLCALTPPEEWVGCLQNSLYPEGKRLLDRMLLWDVKPVEKLRYILPLMKRDLPRIGFRLVDRGILLEQQYGVQMCLLTVLYYTTMDCYLSMLRPTLAGGHHAARAQDLLRRFIQRTVEITCHGRVEKPEFHGIDV